MQEAAARWLLPRQSAWTPHVRGAWQRVDTLIGVVAGGVIAIATSVVVGRYEQTRRHRVTIHLTLLSPVLSAVRGPGWDRRRQDSL
jgi:hypothetical protein